MNMSIYHNYEAIKSLAKQYAKQHGVNYNVILMNPVNNQFGDGSTYEIVQDSYFEIERTNVIRLYKTDDDLDIAVFDSDSTTNNFGLRGKIDPFAPEPMYITNSYKNTNENIQHIVKVEQKIGKGEGGMRNQSCKCGSGKKYKKCCQYK